MSLQHPAVMSVKYRLPNQNRTYQMIPNEESLYYESNNATAY